MIKVIKLFLIIVVLNSAYTTQAAVVNNFHDAVNVYKLYNKMVESILVKVKTEKQKQCIKKVLQEEVLIEPKLDKAKSILTGNLKINSNIGSFIGKKIQENSCLISKFRSFEKARQTADKSKNGWLWDVAVKTAGGNQRLANLLIAGSLAALDDDQYFYQYKGQNLQAESKLAQSDLDNQLKSIMGEGCSFDCNANNAPGCFINMVKSIYEETKNPGLINYKGIAEQNFHKICEVKSRIYNGRFPLSYAWLNNIVPHQFDDEEHIDHNDRNNPIAKNFGISSQEEKFKTLGENTKAYHYYAGIFTGCELSQCFNSDELKKDEANIKKSIGEIAGIVAKSYRSGRLLLDNHKRQSELLDKLEDANDIISTHSLDLNKEASDVLQQLKATFKSIEVNRECPGDLDLHMRQKGYCANVLVYKSLKTVQDKETFLRERVLPALDASSALYESSLKIEDCKKIINSSDQDRCQRKNSLLQSWINDREWTGAQHRVGAEFGFSQCAKMPLNNQNIEDWCPAQQSLNQTDRQAEATNNSTEGATAGPSSK